MTFSGMSVQVIMRAAGLVALVYGLVYLLRIRERRIPVTQWFLWERILRAGESSLWARILRRIFSYLLQLLVAFALLAALMEPRATGEGPRGRSLLILVDLSASMGSTDVKPSRWDVLRGELSARLEGLGPGDSAALVVYGLRPRVVEGWTGNIKKIISRLDTLHPTDEPADHGRALRFARTMLSGRTHPEIGWVTDGQGHPKGVVWLPVPPECSEQSGMPISGITIKALTIKKKLVKSNSYTDHGFVRFSVRPRPDDPDTADAYVRIRRFRGTARAYMDLYVDGNWRTRMDITGDDFERIFPVPLGGSTIQATLSSAGGMDVMSSNDEAFAAAPPVSQPRIALVGEENFFLEAALLLTGGFLKRIPADEYTPSALADCGGDPCNIAVFNEFSPPTVPDVPNQVYIHPPSGPFDVARRHRENLQILWTGGKRPHPIMKGVRMDDVNLWGTWYSFRLAPTDRPLMQIDERGTVVSMLRMDSGRRLVSLGFSLRESDFVLLPYFPVWILNLISWFTGSSPDLIASTPTGTLVDMGTAADTLDTPKNVIRGRIETFVPSWRGIYRAYSNGSETFAMGASLLDAREGDPHTGQPEISCRKVPYWEKPAVIKARTSSLPWLRLLMVFVGALGLLVMGRLRGALGSALVLTGLAFAGAGTVALVLLLGYSPWLALTAGAFVVSWFEWISYHRRMTV